MGQVRFHKVVSALPSPLEKDGLYLVRTGEGFDLYASDSTGAIAHKVNTGASVQDTGWRNMWKHLLGFSLSSSSVYLSQRDQLLFRRIGDRCLFYAYMHTSVTIRNSTSMRALPEGLRPINYVYVNMSQIRGQERRLQISNYGYLTPFDLFSGSMTDHVIEYITNDPFPAQLPGEPWTPT